MFRRPLLLYDSVFIRTLSAVFVTDKTHAVNSNGPTVCPTVRQLLCFNSLITPSADFFMFYLNKATDNGI